MPVTVSDERKTLDRQRAVVRQLIPRLGARAGHGAPLRRSFVTLGEAGFSPLGALLSSAGSRSGGGGRGGRTRLALLVSLYWVCAGEDFSTERPARWWAELLGLRDPSRAGQDVVTSNLHELRRRQFITLDHERPGYPPRITVLREDGGGLPYSIPTGGHDSYFRVPQVLWSSGLITKLSGPGLAVYLILQSVRNRNDPDEAFFFPRGRFETLFGISDLTRRKGFKELVDLDVLTREDVSTDATGGRAGKLSPRAVYRFVS